LITVWLDKKEEFDAIWTYTKAHAQYTEGPKEYYFRSFCDDPSQGCGDQVGVFGGFNIVTALLLAEARWGNGEGIFDYGEEARDVLDAFRTKETQNRGIVDGVINQFDAVGLPVKTPDEEFADQVTSEILMPGYFEYWGQRTGEEFWTMAADRTRQHLRDVINPENGLSPSISYFDGSLVPGEEEFREGSYEVAFNLAVDTAWYAADPEQVILANRLISFFASFGGSYPSYFHYDGTPSSQNVSGALVALNGCAAGISTVPARTNFIRSVWDAPTQVGLFRYFDGINQLIALMYLAGYVRPF
jgi:endo-1,4-beta-D-glucanase Y